MQMPEASCHKVGIRRDPTFGGDFTHNTGTVKGLTNADFAFVGLSLVIPTVIGFYQAWKSRNDMELEEYMLARRSMSFVPVGLSLLASFLSAITMLGAPAEIYSHNTMYFWVGLAFFIVSAGSAHIYIPVFYQLKLTSAYEVSFEKARR